MKEIQKAQARTPGTVVPGGRTLRKASRGGFYFAGGRDTDGTRTHGLGGRGAFTTNQATWPFFGSLPPSMNVIAQNLDYMVLVLMGWDGNVGPARSMDDGDWL